MSGFTPVDPQRFQINPFTIGSDWMLVAAEKHGKANAMTAGWGGLGVMWNKPAAFIVIRPQRYTHDCVEASAAFSINFFTPEHKKMLGYMGSVSGRDEDKIAKAGLAVARAENAPYFEQANLVLLCRKLYKQEYRKECFIDSGLEKEWYPEQDFHTMYVGEVLRILAKS